jgi:predicted anti-sigma-YlaC factor YlaD
MVPSDPNCERARAAVSLDLDDAISELGAERLRSHLAQCDACAQYAQDVRATTASLRSVPLEPVPVPAGAGCEEARMFVSLELDDELEDEERAQLVVHLARCEACARFARDVRARTSMLRAAAHEPLPAPVSLATVRRPRRTRVRLGAGAGAAVAAMLMLAVGVTFMGDGADSPAPTPFDDSALAERQNWDGVPARPIGLRRAIESLRPPGIPV